MACNVIKACATIHNIELQNGIDMLNVGVVDIPYVPEDLDVRFDSNREEESGGREILRQVISHFA